MGFPPLSRDFKFQNIKAITDLAAILQMLERKKLPYSITSTGLYEVSVGSGCTGEELEEAKVAIENASGIVMDRQVPKAEQKAFGAKFEPVCG